MLQAHGEHLIEWLITYNWEFDKPIDSGKKSMIQDRLWRISRAVIIVVASVQHAYDLDGIMLQLKWKSLHEIWVLMSLQFLAYCIETYLHLKNMQHPIAKFLCNLQFIIYLQNY